MAAAFARTPLPFNYLHNRKLAQISSTTTFHMSVPGGTSARNLLMAFDKSRPTGLTRRTAIATRRGV